MNNRVVDEKTFDRAIVALVVGIVVISFLLAILISTSQENIKKLEERIAVLESKSHASTKTEDTRPPTTDFQAQINAWGNGNVIVETVNDLTLERFLYLGEIPPWAPPSTNPRQYQSYYGGSTFTDVKAGAPTVIILYDSNLKVLDRLDVGPYTQRGDRVIARYDTNPLGGITASEANVPFYWNQTTGLMVLIQRINSNFPSGTFR